MLERRREKRENNEELLFKMKLDHNKKFWKTTE